MTSTETATITMTITDKPSRSKGQLWARIGDGAGAVFATETGREATLPLGPATIHLGGTIRRATRTETMRGTREITVTGNPADTATISYGSPQSLDITITGAVN